jgi:hypothetical protein
MRFQTSTRWAKSARAVSSSANSRTDGDSGCRRVPDVIPDVHEIFEIASQCGVRRPQVGVVNAPPVAGHENLVVGRGVLLPRQRPGLIRGRRPAFDEEHVSRA